MAIMLGGYTFGESVTSAQEAVKERGGRDARVVILHGALEGHATVEALEAELDAIAAAASATELTPLSLRPGRRLLVRRAGFTRQVYRDARTAVFELRLEADDAFEQAEEETVVAGVFMGTQLELEVPADGNTPALPRIAITPSGGATRPRLTAGGRSLLYDGVVPAGTTLVIDASAGLVSLDDEDVTPYTEGLPPWLPPGNTLLAYSDESVAMPDVAVEVRFSSRWW
ncbi:MAG: hypothetical protein RLZZ303_2099 [Candidatus Hydrogenedentota bacterium]|jgi:hypothetical protein